MQKRRYITGIDGLRSISVIGVILYHLIPNWMPGGYLGVPLFFVISGYLMTDILMFEWQSRSKIKLKTFYYKRIRRIFPSLIVMLFVSGSVMSYAADTYLLNFRSITISSLLNVNNWWQVMNDVSYFDRFGNASPFTHLWSLSIEGQFYLVWPIVFALLMYKAKDNKRLIHVILSVTVLSGILMAAFYHPDDVNRLYYGTDTRLFSIFMGAGLAVILNTYQSKIDMISTKWKIGAFISSLVAVVLGFIYLKANLAFVYQGGMFLYSLICTILLGSIIDCSVVNSWMTNPLFKWIGSRSYEIYLWQFPVMIIYENTIKWNGNDMFIHLILQLAIILLLSELTFRFVSFMVYDVSWRKINWQQVTASHLNKLYLFIASMMMVSFLYGFVSAPSGRTESSIAIQKKLEENKKEIDKIKKDTTTVTMTNESTKTETTTTSSDAVKTQEKAEELSEKELGKAKDIKLGAIGDSVLLSAAPDLQKIFTNATIDAKVGRQLEDSEDTFKKMSEKKQLGDITLVVLGTNGRFKGSDIDMIMKYVDGKPVFFVNTMVERPWQKSVNDELNKTQKRYKNAHVIDWKTESDGNYQWFEEDNVHMTIEGSHAFTTLITKSILNEIK
ncbi:MAG: acyltransferase family protein [Vagococcus sp.]